MPTWAHVGSKKPSWGRLGGLLGRLGGLLRTLGGVLGHLGHIVVPPGPSWWPLGTVLELQNPPNARGPGRGGGSAAATPGRIPLGLLGYKGYHKEKG